MTESSTTEYKQLLTEGLEKEVVAFLNAKGGLPYGMSEEDFFAGLSVPRNRGLMRIMKDLSLVEHLGSGMPRILRAYPRSCFQFLSHHLRMVLPMNKINDSTNDGVHDGVHDDSMRGRLLQLCQNGPKGAPELLSELGLASRSRNFRNALADLLNSGQLEMSIPDRPRSKNQKYRLPQEQAGEGL